jgi:hypothetical protein
LGRRGKMSEEEGSVFIYGSWLIRGSGWQVVRVGSVWRGAAMHRWSGSQQTVACTATAHSHCPNNCDQLKSQPPAYIHKHEALWSCGSAPDFTYSMQSPFCFILLVRKDQSWSAGNARSIGFGWLARAIIWYNPPCWLILRAHRRWLMFQSTGRPSVTMVAGVPGRTEVEIEKTSRHLHRAFGCHVVPGQSTAMPIPGKRDQTRLTAVVTATSSYPRASRISPGRPRAPWLLGVGVTIFLQDKLNLSNRCLA